MASKMLSLRYSRTLFLAILTRSSTTRLGSKPFVKVRNVSKSTAATDIGSLFRVLASL